MAMGHRQPDRLPKGFFGTADSMAMLRRGLGFDGDDQVLNQLGVDVRHIEPTFVGPSERSGGLQCLDNANSDFWGVPRRLVATEFGTYSEISDSPLAKAVSVAEIEEYQWPSQKWFDTSSIAGQISAANTKEPRWINYHRAGKLFEICWALRGMENLMIDMIERPEMVHAMLRNVLSFYIELGQRVIKVAGGGIDMVTIGDDVGTQRGMMISPGLWREIIKPYLKEMVKAFHDLNVKVMYHSCGSILAIIPELIDIGVDVLEPIQTSAQGMDPSALKDAYGDRLCFHGGVDEQRLLPFGSPDQIREEVMHLASTLGRGGGYILMAAHAFQPDIPVENVLAMYEAADHCYTSE